MTKESLIEVAKRRLKRIDQSTFDMKRNVMKYREMMTLNKDKLDF